MLKTVNLLNLKQDDLLHYFTFPDLSIPMDTGTFICHGTEKVVSLAVELKTPPALYGITKTTKGRHCPEPPGKKQHRHQQGRRWGRARFESL